MESGARGSPETRSRSKFPTRTKSVQGGLDSGSGQGRPAEEIASLDHFALERGKELYDSLCITCHGTPRAEGSLPTALKFPPGEFKNGSDPWSMFRPSTKDLVK